MIHLHNELYKACAGECWEEMKDSCLRKVKIARHNLCSKSIFPRFQMKIVEKDRRVEAVMDVVGQCLEDSNEKTVRISVLKLLTGIFTEKEVVFLRYRNFIPIFRLDPVLVLADI